MNGYSSHVRIKKDYFTLSYIHLSPATVFGQFDHKFASAQDIIWKSKASHRKQHEPLKGKNPFSFSMWLAWKMKKSWYFSWIISKKNELVFILYMAIGKQFFLGLCSQISNKHEFYIPSKDDICIYSVFWIICYVPSTILIWKTPWRTRQTT